MQLYTVWFCRRLPSPTLHRCSHETFVSGGRKRLTIWGSSLEKAKFSLHDCQENSIPRPFHFGCIAGVGLGVFEEEPEIHPDLLELENLVITPHIVPVAT